MRPRSAALRNSSPLPSDLNLAKPRRVIAVKHVHRYNGFGFKEVNSWQLK